MLWDGINIEKNNDLEYLEIYKVLSKEISELRKQVGILEFENNELRNSKLVSNLKEDKHYLIDHCIILVSEINKRDNIIMDKDKEIEHLKRMLERQRR